MEGNKVKKNAFQKLKEGLDDKEEQLAIISLFVRLGVVVWSGFIVTRRKVVKKTIKLQKTRV